MKALSREQVRMIDRLAIERYGVSGLVLMENAGRNASDAIEKILERDGLAKGLSCSISGGELHPSDALAGRRIAVVAGTGNNGGDGFVVARHLAMRGAAVVTFIVAPAENIAGDAAANLAILRHLQHDVRQIAAGELRGLAGQLRPFDLIVDAIGGTGICGQLRSDMATSVEQVNSTGLPIIAIDIPTGLDCDTGQPLGPTIRAAMTVTFVACKIGFDSPQASQYTGTVAVADIGIPAEQVLAINLPFTS
ncbi:MAG: NAD(P)H-hydrate epimerase [Planctomycetaceae bacterium]|nr:MAG: NAD(P)H-hydrate epimerase [Planctomycetaceae bacterium]